MDLIEIGDYIGRDSARAELRFFDAVETAFRRLQALPFSGRPYNSRSGALEGLRVMPIHGFSNWLICYRPTDESIEIIRVVHGARDLPRVLTAQWPDVGDDEPDA